jgi:hypothetical protein
MSAAPIGQRSVETRSAPGCRMGIVLLLAACIESQVGVALAAGPVEPGCRNQDESCEALPLEQLSATIDHLKASLSALRQNLESRREGGEDGDQAIVDELCAAPLAEASGGRDAAVTALEQLRVTMESERAAARAAAATASDELSALRERLPRAEAEVTRLNEDRARLVSRIKELDGVVAKEPATEAVATRAESRLGAPIDAAQAAEPDATPERQLMLQVAQPGPADFAPPGTQGRAAGQRPAPPVDRLQLRAELALAQLKIAELTSALESARLRQEGMQAEVSTLRALTDAKIRELMGLQ